MAITFQKHRLPSGLTILAETDPEAHTSAIGFFVKAGSRDESKELMGVSHFLEHMMFKSTVRGRTADDVNREFDEIGADYNAFTSQEMTAYYAHILPEFMPRAVDLLSDMLRPGLTLEDFTMEKNVILEEIGMYEDRPQWRLSDTATEIFFADHPMGYRVLGTTDSIKSLSVEQMRAYFDERYSCRNITVAAAGRFDFETLVRDIENRTSGWKASGQSRHYVAPRYAVGERQLTDAKVNRHYIEIMSPAPTVQDLRRYAAKIAADVIGDDEGSRLYWALVDPGLADEAGLSYVPHDQAGLFSGFVSCDPERAQAVEKVFVQTLEGYADSIEPIEIERAKNKIATQATLHGERPMGRMSSLGSVWTYQAEYVPLEEELRRIMAVTPQEVRDLLKAMPFEHRTVVRLGPGT